MPRAWRRTTETTRSVTMAAKTGAAVNATTDRAEAASAAAESIAADATVNVWMRNRSVFEDRPLRASPRDSPVKMTWPVSNMPASIMARDVLVAGGEDEQVLTPPRHVEQAGILEQGEQGGGPADQQ